MSRYEKVVPQKFLGSTLLAQEVERIKVEFGLDPGSIVVHTAFGFDQMANPGYFAQVWVEGSQIGDEGSADDYFLEGLDGLTDGEGASRCMDRLKRFGLEEMFKELYPEGWAAMCMDNPF